MPTRRNIIIMEKLGMSSILGYVASAGSFFMLGWADLLSAFLIGFIGAVGGLLANLLFLYVKKKIK